ncbi:MAG TPA: ATP-dependent DNA ligase, partial [Longimicrobiales bacterium]
EHPGPCASRAERSPQAAAAPVDGEELAFAFPHSPPLPLSPSAGERLATSDMPLSPDIPLHQFAARCIAPLPALPEDAKRRLMFETWAQLDPRERFVWHKLIGGAWRVGVSTTLVVRALAKAAGVEPAVMAHRVMGDWEPTPEAYLRILHGAGGAAGDEGASDPGQPYPFYLAHPLEGEPADLGERAAWQVEWKWDGIRAQVIRRAGQTLVWSRGEELVTNRFPEITEVARLLPEGTVLDGELLCWKDEAPLPFAVMQRRIGRKTVGPKIRAEAPVAFVAFDVLEQGGRDMREQPLRARRALLQATLAGLPGTAFRLSPLVDATTSWPELARLREESRRRGVEGFMLKRLDSPYGVGRRKGDWWKWKIEPYTVDAVLIYAQRGSGRRASLYTDYTFAVRSGDELVPVAKAYSGLNDEEIRRVDRFVRENTIQKFGPVRAVKPELVFELAFEGIQESTRHRAGIAVRFPRIARWRQDKKVEEADTIESLRELVRAHAERGSA